MEGPIGLDLKLLKRALKEPPRPPKNQPRKVPVLGYL